MYEEDMSPEDAQSQIDQITGEAHSNPDHPFTNARHPQHQQTVERVFALRQQATAERFDGDDLRNFNHETLAAMEQGMDEKAGRDVAAQQALMDEARAEMKMLGEHGFEDDSDLIDENITPDEVRSLRQERLIHTGDYNQLNQLFHQQAHELNITPESQDLLNAATNFLAGAPNDKETQDIAYKVIDRLNQIRKARKETM